MFNFFKAVNDSEGPGVYLDTPRKKGIKRFFEILMRDGTDFWLSGLLSFLTILPGTLLVATSVMSNNLFWAIIFGILGGMIASPFFAVLVDTIVRAQRDEPGYWWVRYRKAFKNNFKGSLLPGAILGGFLGMQSTVLFVYLPTNNNIFFLASVFISILITVFFSVWFVPQLVLFNMSFGQIFKNSLILSFSQLPRTLGAAVFVILYWGLIAFFFPISTVALILTTVWLPAFLAMSCIYPALDKTFQVEKQLKEKREAELAKSESYFL